MKIISFAVNNFGCISGGLDKNRVCFDNSNTIFIFGQNNVGKSSFLKAYEFFYKSETPNLDDFFKTDIEKILEFELEVELDSFDFSKIELVAPSKKDSLKKWLREGKFLKVKREFGVTEDGKTQKIEKAKNSTFNPSTNTWDDKCYGSIGLNGVFQACLPTPIFIKAMPTEEEVENIINQILSAKAKNCLEVSELDELKSAQKTIQTLQEKMYNPTSIKSYKDQVNAHFKQLFPETQIEIEEKDKIKWTENALGKKFNIKFEKIDTDGVKDESIPSSYSKIGHGAIRSAMFALLLMKDVAEEFERVDNRKDYLVLFEEPELFLHPKLLKGLRSLIYKVSEDTYPYQVLCASHSPQMIDISKPKSSLGRMIKEEEQTTIFQIDEEDLQNAADATTKAELKEELYEILRFNPFICESFYADEVVLVEGPTEEIILRGYLKSKEDEISKDLFIVNCGTVNNIPFFQKVFSKFHIKYHVICDTDSKPIKGTDSFGSPIFEEGVQKSIYEQLKIDQDDSGYRVGILRVHDTTFEVAHEDNSIPVELRYIASDYNISDGKPFNANRYWKDKLSSNLAHADIVKVPIISFLEEIINH